MSLAELLHDGRDHDGHDQPRRPAAKSRPTSRTRSARRRCATPQPPRRLRERLGPRSRQHRSASRTRPQQGPGVPARAVVTASMRDVGQIYALDGKVLASGILVDAVNDQLTCLMVYIRCSALRHSARIFDRPQHCLRSSQRRRDSVRVGSHTVTANVTPAGEGRHHDRADGRSRGRLGGTMNGLGSVSSALGRRGLASRFPGIWRST